jgi:hypothetical protein
MKDGINGDYGTVEFIVDEEGKSMHNGATIVLLHASIHLGAFPNPLQASIDFDGKLNS